MVKSENFLLEGFAPSPPLSPVATGVTPVLLGEGGGEGDQLFYFPDGFGRGIF
jgi:hypothetical protein